MTDKPLPQIVAEWPRNNHELIRVTLTEYRSQPVIDIRVHYHRQSEGWLPGRQGITVGTRHLSRLVEALKGAKQKANK